MVLNVPVSGPVHEVVAGNQRRQPEEDLSLGAAEGVEDEVVTGTGKGVLSVGGQTKGDDALLLLTTCQMLVSRSWASFHLLRCDC